jgi:hypothetical protein
MGLFKSAKRFVKKITKPVSKVLDKVIPNEIKPLLPYAAAFAPYMMPVAGIGATPSFFQSAIGRALLSGGANLGSQLAQEGSEGDFSGLSTLLAAAQGYGTTPGAAEKLRSGIVSEAPNNIGKPLTFLDKTKNVGLETLAKGAEGLSKARDILSPGGAEVGLNMETAKAAMIPFTQGSGDLAMAAARTAMKDYEAELAAFNAQAGETQAGNDNARRSAITSSMLAANFAQDVIDSTLAQIGLKDGGRVGKMNGGIMNAKRGLVNAPGGYAGDIEFAGIEKAVQKADKKLLEEINNSPMSNEGTPQMYASDSAGTIGLKNGEGVEGIVVDQMIAKERPFYQLSDFNNEQDYGRFLDIVEEYKSKKNGGIIGLNMGGSVLPSGGEMDYRAGGFIPMGSKEKADDVPARLSKNEFVMTADAVKAAGGGSVNQGAKRMYDLMNNLEARV